MIKRILKNINRVLNKKNNFCFFVWLVFACNYLFLTISIVYAKPVNFKFSEKTVTDEQILFDTSINNNTFNLGDKIKIRVNMTANSSAVKSIVEQLDGLYLLIMAERIFDKQGHYHQFNNNFNSTVLTPSGLPVENFNTPTPRFLPQTAESIDELSSKSQPYTECSLTPFYKYCFVKKSLLSFTQNRVGAQFNIKDIIGTDFLEGYYRFHIKVFCKIGRYFHRINLAPFFANNKIEYSQWKVGTSVRTVSCLPVIKIGAPKTPKMIWTLFMQYYSNGTQGLVSIEDSPYFQFSSRHILSSKFILPPQNQSEKTQEYTLEPDFPTMFANRALERELTKNWNFQTPIPLNYNSGELSVSVKNPDGTITDLGTEPFRSQSNLGATTNSNKFRYRFTQYGKYLITMKGWIEDIWGNKYNGGGTYEVWIANRLTFATSVKPGTPFEVGNAYTPSVIVHPPCPADIKIEVKLYRNSSKKDVTRYTVQGRANRFGYFYPRSKFKKIILDSPGEYLSETTATYTDKKGRFWMGAQRSGSVVAPIDSKLMVYGAPLSNSLKIKISTRGNSHYEGRIDEINNPQKSSYNSCKIQPFPYYSGDIFYTANSFRGDNGIVPVLIAYTEKNVFSKKNNTPPLKTTTTNQYQPQDYPEFLKTQAYNYISAIRPGLSARFIISENPMALDDSYWQSGGNFAGNQINNSINGDLPQDIYEFFGGTVFRDFEKGINLYGIYASMGVILPQGSYANRVSAPFSEPILTVNGRDYYLFDSGAPLPGMVFEPGDILRAGALVSPPVAGVNCTKTITAPSGKKYVFKGATNKIGLAKMAADEGDEIVIKEPGVYEVDVLCESKGKKGDILGSRDGRYFIYVIDSNDSGNLINLGLADQFSISYKNILEIKGKILASIKNPKIYYTLVMPGVIMDEGVLPVENNAFRYRFSPRDVAVHFTNYDIISYNDPTQQLMADTVIFTFFLTGIDNTGKPVNSVKRFILRGDKGMLLD